MRAWCGAEAGWDPPGPFSSSGGGESGGEAGMKRRMLEMMREGGCRQPNEVLAAAKRMLADGEAALKLSLTAGWFAACAAWRLRPESFCGNKRMQGTITPRRSRRMAW